MEGIFTALRSRFGMTAKEARSRLNKLRRDTRQSLHDHATEVEKLVKKGYGADLPDEAVANMAVDIFCVTVGDSSLQRHHLAVQPETLSEAVQSGQEFLQVQSERSSSSTSSRIRAMEDSDSQEEATTDPWSRMRKELAELKAKNRSMMVGSSRG